MSSKGTPVRTVRMTDDLYGRVRLAATEDGCTASDVIVAALNDWLAVREVAAKRTTTRKAVKR